MMMTGWRLSCMLFFVMGLLCVVSADWLPLERTERAALGGNSQGLQQGAHKTQPHSRRLLMYLRFGPVYHHSCVDFSQVTNLDPPPCSLGSQWSCTDISQPTLIQTRPSSWLFLVGLFFCLFGLILYMINTQILWRETCVSIISRCVKVLSIKCWFK